MPLQVIAITIGLTKIEIYFDKLLFVQIFCTQKKAGRHEYKRPHDLSLGKSNLFSLTSLGWFSCRPFFRR